jgi:hypothetical protein
MMRCVLGLLSVVLGFASAAAPAPADLVLVRAHAGGRQEPGRGVSQADEPAFSWRDRSVDITCRFIDFVAARRRRSRFHQACLATIVTALQPFVEDIHGCADKYANDRGNLAPHH